MVQVLSTVTPGLTALTVASQLWRQEGTKVGGNGGGRKREGLYCLPMVVGVGGRRLRGGVHGGGW